jgi:hypothetical protein
VVELAQAGDPAPMVAEKFRLEGLSSERQTKASEKKEGLRATDKSKDASSLIENQGQIKKLSIPTEWQEATAGGDRNIMRRERIFHPRDRKAGKQEEAKNADFVILDSGRPVDETDEKALRQVLQASPHKLTAAELKQIERALGDLSDPQSFKLEKAECRDINGKRVLDVKGVWLFNRNRYHGIVITSTQQIYLMSPPAAYARLNQSFESACRTIEWQ